MRDKVPMEEQVKWNFLAPILERKLAVVEKRYGKSQLDFERIATQSYIRTQIR